MLVNLVNLYPVIRSSITGYQNHCFNVFNFSGVSCLDDIPSSPGMYTINPIEYPGYQMFNAEEQCRLVDDDYIGTCGHILQLDPDYVSLSTNH